LLTLDNKRFSCDGSLNAQSGTEKEVVGHFLAIITAI
jgi:hypothetical protein